MMGPIVFIHRLSHRGDLDISKIHFATSWTGKTASPLRPLGRPLTGFNGPVCHSLSEGSNGSHGPQIGPSVDMYRV